MIQLSRDDISRVDVAAIVCPVNTEGVGGKGLALEFKHRFPEHWFRYVAACNTKRLLPGGCLLVKYQPVNIIFAATKEHWARASRLQWIDSAAKGIELLAAKDALLSVAVPALGCGLGALDWNDVKPLLEKHFAPSAVRFTVLEPR